MGRRSSHKPDELRKFILDSTRELIEEDGFVELSAREIARKINYSAGTIYNVFENLDDLLLTVQIELLDRTVTALKSTPKDPDARKYVAKLARCYFDFALENARLWNLLFQHQLPKGAQIPALLNERIEELIGMLALELKPLLRKSGGDDAERAARILWAGIHGVSAIAVTNKCPPMSDETAQWYATHVIDALIEGVLKA